VYTQTGAISALEFNLKAAQAQVLGRQGWHFDKARRGGHRRHRLAPAFGDLLFEVVSPSSQVLGHARGREGRGQRHDLIPEGIGNTFVGMRAVLTPVLKLAGELAELVIGV